MVLTCAMMGNQIGLHLTHSVSGVGYYGFLRPLAMPLPRLLLDVPSLTLRPQWPNSINGSNTLASAPTRCASFL